MTKYNSFKKNYVQPIVTDSSFTHSRHHFQKEYRKTANYCFFQVSEQINTHAIR